MATRVLVVLSALVLGGCILPVEFDPVGEAASMQGSWTIDGAPPAPESCEAAEVRFVRIRFYQGERRRDHAGLVFECHLGSFDTRPERLVAAGEYEIAPAAIRADGSEVALGPRQPVDTGGGMHVVVTPFDIPGGAG